MTSNLQSRDDANHEPRLGSQHRRKRSNPLRCLAPLRYGAYALGILLLLEVVEDLICEKAPPPPIGEEMFPIDGVEVSAAVPVDSGNCLVIAPEWLAWVMMAVVVLSAIACVHRWWRSFSRREYYRNQLGER